MILRYCLSHWYTPIIIIRDSTKCNTIYATRAGAEWQIQTVVFCCRIWFERARVTRISYHICSDFVLQHHPERTTSVSYHTCFKMNVRHVHTFPCSSPHVRHPLPPTCISTLHASRMNKTLMTPRFFLHFFVIFLNFCWNFRFQMSDSRLSDFRWDSQIFFQILWLLFFKNVFIFQKWIFGDFV